GAGMFLSLAPGRSCGILGLGYLLAQRLDLLPQRRGGIDRLWWRDERTGVEVRLPAIGAMEPDPQRAGELERRQRIVVAALGLMHRDIPELAQGVEDVGDFLGNDPFVGQPPKRVVKGLALVAIGTMAGSDDLGSELGELPQLDNGRRWVV